MNVLFVCDAIDPALGGGVAERTYRLASALQDLGVESAVLSTRLGLGEQRRGELAGIDCTLVPALGWRFIFPLMRPATVAARVRSADILHITGHWSWLGALSGWLARRHRRPYVYSPAGALPVSGRSRTLERLYNALIGKRLVRGASLCMAITEQEREDFHRYGVPNERIVVLPNGVDPRLPPDLQPRRARDKHGIGEAPLILFLGRLHRVKGADLLIEAFSRVAVRHPRARLVLAGPDAGQKRDLIRQSQRLGLEDRVLFTGNLAGRDKQELLAAADFLVVPSRREAMSLVVLEAGLLGTPALITDQCGFDALERASGGHIVSASVEGLANGLSHMLDEPHQWPLLGCNLRRLVLEHYTWPHLAMQARVLYRNLVDPPAGGRGCL